MQLNIYKYEATGNDFILINKNELPDKKLDSKDIKHICDRHFGIGADGLIIISKQQDNYDFAMKYYNSNGYEGTMCGNGGRAAVAFANKLQWIENKAKFTAIDGEHTAEIDENKLIRLKMQDVLVVNKQTEAIFVLNTGSPHYVQFIKEDLNSIDFIAKTKEIRYNNIYKKEGVNVNFVNLSADNNILVRTYERGVEDETLSCGTGSVAVAIATYLKQKTKQKHFKIQTQGGDLLVDLEENNNIFQNIYLTGYAKFVFNTYLLL